MIVIILLYFYIFDYILYLILNLIIYLYYIHLNYSFFNYFRIVKKYEKVFIFLLNIIFEYLAIYIYNYTSRLFVCQNILKNINICIKRKYIKKPNLKIGITRITFIIFNNNASRILTYYLYIKYS